MSFDLYDKTGGLTPDEIGNAIRDGRTVDTFADLRTLTGLNDCDLIYLKGHTTSGVGGGMFRVDTSNTDPDDNGVTAVTGGGVRIVRELNGYVTPEMFGLSTGADVSSALPAMASINPTIIVDYDYIYSTDINITTDGVILKGNGSLTAVSGSGADFRMLGNNPNLGIPIHGNEIKSAAIVSTTAGEITVDDGTDFTANDEVIVFSTDVFRRVIWVGSVDSVASNTLTVSDNVIDGDFSDLSGGETIYILKSDRWTGEVIFGGGATTIESPTISTTRQFSRDIRFSNCNAASHGKLNTKNCNLVYVFCSNSNCGDVVSIDSSFYGRSIQGSKGGVFGGLYAENPYFSTHVEKGCHDMIIGDITSIGAPVMSYQSVAYPGSIPSTLNPLCQSDLLSSSNIHGDLTVENGNWIASIKDNSDDFIIGNISSKNAYKSFFADAGWDVIRAGDITINGHNVGGSARTANSSGAIYATNGEEFIARSIELNDVDTGSANGCAFFDGVNLSADSIGVNGCESFFNIDSAALSVSKINSKDNIDGFQIFKFNSMNYLSIGKVSGEEGLNTNLDRLVFVAGSSSNVSIGDGTIQYSGTISPTDGIRVASTGDNIKVGSITTKCVDTATCTNSVRSNGVSGDVSIIGAVAAAGVTNAVNVSSVTDTLRVNLCTGTIIDSSSATTKDVTTGNI